MGERYRVISWRKGRHVLTKQDVVVEISIFADGHHVILDDISTHESPLHVIFDLSMNFDSVLRVRWSKE